MHISNYEIAHMNNVSSYVYGIEARKCVIFIYPCEKQSGSIKIFS